MPPEHDPFCVIQEFVIAVTTGNGYESKPNQLIVGRCRFGKSGRHMEFHLPSQTIGGCVWHRTMNAHVDSFSEASMKGIFWYPITIAGAFALRRFGTNKLPLPKTFVSLLLQNSQCFKEGAKLVKIIYVDTNQLGELLLSLESCVYHGASLQGDKPWVDEAQLLQVYRLTDVCNSHVTTYIAPVRDNPVHDLDRRDTGKNHPLWNDCEKSVEATVNAFHNQVAQRLMRCEPGPLTNGRGSMQLTAEYFAQQDPEQVAWSSFRNRSFLVADQRKPSMWVTRQSKLCLPIDRSKTLAQANEEIRRGPRGAPTAGLRTREVAEVDRCPVTPQRTTIPDTPLDTTKLYLCTTQYDRGEDPDDYEDGVHYVDSSVKTPLDISHIGYAKFLCNRAYDQEYKERPAFGPMEWSTNDEKYIAITMKREVCPFIMSDSPSDFRDNITLVLEAEDIDSYWNGYKLWTPLTGKPPAVQLTMNMARPSNWDQERWDDVCKVTFWIGIFPDGQQDLYTRGLHNKCLKLPWPDNVEQGEIAESIMKIVDWEDWRKLFRELASDSPWARLPCLRKQASIQACDAGNSPDWDLYQRPNDPPSSRPDFNLDPFPLNQIPI